jgi:hypothetical protein
MKALLPDAPRAIAFIRSDISANIETLVPPGGSVLRVSVSLVVIGFATSIRAAAAHDIPPQPPPLGYPPPIIRTGTTHHPCTMAMRGIHHLRIIGRIRQSRFRAGMRTQMRKATVMNTTDLTRQGECLAMCRAGSDQGL